jgi:hypothetical protein
MLYKKYAWVIAIAALMISSCTMSYSKSGATVPTTSPFTNPLPTGDNTMKKVERFATQTAMAKTAVAGGGALATPIVETGGNTSTPTNTPLGGLIIRWRPYPYQYTSRYWWLGHSHQYSDSRDRPPGNLHPAGG